jgi:hypothetical protein
MILHVNCDYFRRNISPNLYALQLQSVSRKGLNESCNVNIIMLKCTILLSPEILNYTAITGPRDSAVVGGLRYNPKIAGSRPSEVNDFYQCI